MKKHIFFFIAALSVFTVVYTQPANMGGGLMLSSGYHFKNVNYDFNKSGNLALAFKHVHKISLPIELAPSFVFFYPHVTKNLYSKTTISTVIFDIDGHYKFNSLDRFEFYGIAGLNILLAWKRDKSTAAVPTSPTGTPGPAGEPVILKERDKAMGLNLGAGSYMKLNDQFKLYLDMKYTVSKYSQFSLSTGILIDIDWLKKHENTL
jgi:hypothetical protein